MKIVILYIKSENCTYNEYQKPFALRFFSNNYNFDFIYITNNDKIIKYLLPENLSIDHKNILAYPPIHLNYNLTFMNKNHIEIVCFPNLSKNIGIYWESWAKSNIQFSNNYLEMSISKIPLYINRLIISFVSPIGIYNKESCSKTGLKLIGNFNFKVLKELIRLARIKNPYLKTLISVGGDGYSRNNTWNNITNENINSIVDLINDIDADGVDIDYEDDTKCIGQAVKYPDKDNISCLSDEIYINYIESLRQKLRPHLLITSATAGKGAYGTTDFPLELFNKTFSTYYGRMGRVLKHQMLDEIFIMTYDEGKKFDPIKSFESYKLLTKNTTPIYIGIEVPREAYPKYPNEENHELTIEESIKYAKFCLENIICGGIFIWSSQKFLININADTYLNPICKVFNLNDCESKVYLGK